MLTKLVALTCLLTIAFAQLDREDQTDEAGSTEPEEDPISDCRRLACYVFTDDGTAYDLTPLTKIGDTSDDDYLQPLEKDVSSLEFNFCKYLHRSAFFARRLSMIPPYTTILTNDQCAPHSVDEVLSGDEIIGIKVVQMSENVCTTETNYSFTFKVLCDETITEDGMAVIQGTDASDPCSPVVTFSHAAGCHKAKETVIVEEGSHTETVIIQKEVQPLSELIFSNPYLFGGFLIIIGIPPAFFGTMWFKYICGLFGGFSAIVVSAFSLEALEFMDHSSWGFWPCIGISVVVGIIVGLILLKFVMIGSILIGITFGGVTGLMLWNLVNAWMTWKHWIPALACAGVGAALGVVVSCKYSNKTIMYGTSLIGSYTFMRGWSLIFKGYAGEQMMFKMLGIGEAIELEWQMGIYVTLLYFMFTITSFIQFNTGEKRDAMPEEVKKQGNDLNDIQKEIQDDEEEKEYEN